MLINMQAVNTGDRQSHPALFSWQEILWASFEVEALTSFFPSLLFLRCLLCSLRDAEEVTSCFSGSDCSVPCREKKFVLTAIRL